MSLFSLKFLFWNFLITHGIYVNLVRIYYCYFKRCNKYLLKIFNNFQWQICVHHAYKQKSSLVKPIFQIILNETFHFEIIIGSLAVVRNNTDTNPPVTSFPDGNMLQIYSILSQAWYSLIYNQDIDHFPQHRESACTPLQPDPLRSHPTLYLILATTNLFHISIILPLTKVI
jgi:hypothetical protein